MSEPSLQELERDVAAARERLAGDLAVLRSPATFSDFKDDLKQEALGTKDKLIDNAKSAATSSIQGIIDDLKAKAAANPAATLAIGAGIAWRLIQRPPIATALIGAGLFSLLRTSTPADGASTDAEHFARAKERLREQTTEVAGVVKEHAAAMAESAKEKAQEWGDQAGTAAQQFAANLQKKGAAVADQASHAFGAARRDTSAKALHTAADLRQTASDATGAAMDMSKRLRVSDRDKLLLGAAGFAVTAALGLAIQRRANNTED